MKKNHSQKSFLSRIKDRYFQSFLSVLGLALVVVMFLCAFLAPLIANNKPYYYERGDEMLFPVLEDVIFIGQFFQYPELKEINFRKLRDEGRQALWMPPIPYSPTEYDLDSVLVAPSSKHFMGTDEQGRDIAARMVYGAQVSLLVGLVAVGIYVLLGLIIGSIAGYFGGWVDLVIMRIIEIVMCFPTFFLILTILAFVGPSLVNVMIVIGLTEWTGIARLVRGEFLRIKNLEYVESAKVLGYSHFRIMMRHILPNTLTPVLVSVTFGIASAILIESSLSFLGFGVQPPTPSWGDILSQSREFIDIAWWLMFYPGVAIFLTVTAFNLMGEGLRDALDPKAVTKESQSDEF